MTSSYDEAEVQLNYVTSHSIVIFLAELAALAGIAVWVRQILAHHSGLSNPDTVRRVWENLPDIIQQPVKIPIVFAVALGFGAKAFAMDLAWFFALAHNTISRNEYFAMVTVILFFLSKILIEGLSALSVILFYRASGGSEWKRCALTFSALTSLVVTLNMSFSHRVMYAVSTLAICVFQLPFYIYGAYLRLPATASRIYNRSVVPDWVKLERTMFLVAGPLALVRFIDHHLFSRLILHPVTGEFATFVLLSTCALASAFSVNRALLANEFQWQWRAFLTPVGPLAVVEALLLLHDSSAPLTLSELIVSFAGRLATYGGSGVAGAYIYLRLAGRRVSARAG